MAIYSIRKLTLNVLPSKGKHLRHARDHYVLLLENLLGPAPHVMSYDTRIRNTPMETSRAGAKDALIETIQQLEEMVPQADVDGPVTLHAITPHMHEFQSTFGREVSVLAMTCLFRAQDDSMKLWFASLHCVHHWSMVR